MSAFVGDDHKQDFKTVKSMLAELGYTVPTLFKQYTDICEPGGVMFSNFNVDPNFAERVDGFVIVDTEIARAVKHRRYIGAAAANSNVVDIR